MSYLIYLRKSRADKEAEARGEGETLERHDRILTEMALKMGLEIGDRYKELVSADTIAERPKMQQLLLEVMQGQWEGVIVMEVERLARGDTKDQGTVAEAFKFSDTKIITPMKTYDPADEYDEEYFEFSLFMSRREYKTINRRIQRGRLAAFKEGWYIAGTAPYGYKKIKHKENKGFVLEIVPDEAKTIQYIYDLYTHGELQEDGSHLRLGSYQIRDRLNELKIPSRSERPWSAASVVDILSNPTYCGYQRWQWRKEQKRMIDGTIVGSRPKDNNCLKVRGRFSPIITDKQFELVQKIKSNRSFPTNINTGNALRNPLSGLVYCAKCGTMMTRQQSNTKLQYPILRCPNSKCDNISSPLSLVEEGVLAGLKEWSERYETKWPEKPGNEEKVSLAIVERSLHEISTKCDQTAKQLNTAFDLLEQGVYDLKTFQERRRTLETQRDELSAEQVRLEKEFEAIAAREKARKEFAPAVRHIVEVYDDMDDAQSKNSMLWTVIERIDYLKTERNKKGAGQTANFELKFYPRIPESR